MRTFCCTLFLATLVGAAPAGLADNSRVTYLGDDAGTGFAILELDLEGLYHNDTKGNAFNDYFLIDIGTDAALEGFGFDVVITTINGSAVRDAKIAFENAPGDPSLDPTNANSATNLAHSLSPIFFDNIGWGGLSPGADGLYRIEFYEQQVHNFGLGDLVYEQGSTMTLFVSNYVPAPGTAAAMLLTAPLLVRRRRTGMA